MPLPRGGSWSTPLSRRRRDVVFKRMLGALGVGGPSVDTVLSEPNTQPGG
ncbi:MAG TPA: sporulation protein, partial [Actinoplanes sp.]|nr:sporulation protein [Actinoplanes sp.]